MRVGVLHNLPRGGAPRRMAEQLRHLAAEQVEVCLGGAEPVTPDATIVPWQPLAPRLPRAARPALRYADLAGAVVAWRRAAVRMRRLRPEVIFANPCRFLQGPLALTALPMPSLYFCDEPHLPASDTDMRASRNDSTERLYAPLYEAERRLDRAATLAATALATNSRFTAARIEAIYGRPATVLPMGVPESFDASFETPRHLLSVGALLPDKGHELAVRAAALSQVRWPLVILTPRPDPEAEGRLARLAAELRVELTVRSAVSDAEVAATYRGAVALLYLAREEPFGLASIEAQRCGTPVIVSAAGGLPETIAEGITGWAVTRDPAAAAARLDELADHERRAVMGREAAKRAEPLTWRSAAAALDVLLRKVARYDP
jgi:glycosyltransferase involved in cell wall biosynthesis